MIKAKVGFQQDSIAQKIQKLRVIIGKMLNNANFPDAQAMVTALQTRVNELETAAQEAQNSDKTTKSKFVTQGEIESDVDTLTASLLTDVNQKAGGNETKLLSSGFELAKTAEAAKVPGPVTDFSLTRADYPGEIDGHCHAVKGARAYESRLIVGALPEGDWTSGPTFFASKFEWTGLTAGDRMWIEVRATGTAGVGPWSDAISIVVG